MPVKSSYYDNEKLIVIIEMSGMCDADELSEVVGRDVVDYTLSREPEPMHVIYDVRELEWDFQQFIKYLGILAERRKNRVMPSNLTQHFIGNNQWLRSFRSWMSKRFNEDLSGFTTIEQAIIYIQHLDEQ
jgi:hypothetical protein